MTAKPTHLRIKICGLTDADQALACAEMGADAIGLMFYPKSPRNLSLTQARALSRALPQATARVGVFVNADVNLLLETIQTCGLTAVQLHGDESPELIIKLREHGVTVIKGLFAARPPYLHDARLYPADAILAECGRGRLPGGNAESWDWSAARTVSRTHPLILAGGLNPENVAHAITLARPDGVDVSSGVEESPGRKDLRKVAAFIEAAGRALKTARRHRAFPASGGTGSVE